MVATKGLKGLL